MTEEFGIQNLASFSVIVEGRTDQDFIARAAELALSQHQINVLEIPQHLRDGGSDAIAVRSPIARDGTNRGGASRCVYLAQILRPYWLMGLYRGIAFLFDHDEDGRNAKADIDRLHVPGYLSLTLEPSKFSSRRASGDTFIEDMVSIRLHEEFFSRGGATCEYCYNDGDLVQVRWQKRSKYAFCGHSKSSGTCDDFVGVLAVIQAIRAAWGLPNVPLPITPAQIQWPVIVLPPSTPNEDWSI